MRVPDTTLIVSAIFQVAEKVGTEKVTPGMVTSFLTKQFGLDLPLHTVSEIMSSLGIITHTVLNNRYIIWNNESMSELKETYIARFSMSTTTNGSKPNARS
jgi:hypothetical protein